MADAKLKIIVDLINNAKGELAGLQKDLEGVDAAAKKGNTGMQDFATSMGKMAVIAAGVGIAVKKAFDFAQSGADIEQTRESFERLGVSIEDLRAASLGTIDDMTLMKGVLTLTAGASEELQEGLLAASPQLLEIAKAANKLNPTLGDTAFMYESLATGIKRGSKLIIDNTGIVFSQAEAYETYADTLGKTADELTETEKKLAFLYATLGTGDRLIEQAGGNVEAQGDAYAQLEVAVKNASGALREQADILLGPAATALANQITGVNELTETYGHAATAEAYFNSVYKLRQNAQELDIEQMLERERLIKLNTPATSRYADRQKYLAEQEALLAENTAGTTSAMDEFNQAIGPGQALLDGLAAAQGRANEASAVAEIAFLGAAAALGEMSIATFVKTQLDALTEANEAGALSADELAAATRALLVEFGLLTPAEESAQGTTNRLNAAFAAGKISADAYALAMRNLKGSIDNLESRTVYVDVVTQHHQVGQPPSQRGQEQAAGGVSGGGWTLVGERGPEMVNLPQGASVMSNPVTNNTYNTHYNTTVNTRATSGTYAQDIAMARAMGG